MRKLSRTVSYRSRGTLCKTCRLKRVMTLASSDCEESDREDAKEIALGGRKELFTVPYFLSQHPLSSRGKSIPGVKGHAGGILFVLCRAGDCRVCASLQGIFERE